MPQARQNVGGVLVAGGGVNTAEVPLRMVLSPQILIKGPMTRLIQGCSLPFPICSRDRLQHPPPDPERYEDFKEKKKREKHLER